MKPEKLKSLIKNHLKVANDYKNRKKYRTPEEIESLSTYHKDVAKKLAIELKHQQNEKES